MNEKILSKKNFLIIDLLALLEVLFSIAFNKIPLMTLDIADCLSMLRLLMWMIIFAAFKYCKADADIKKSVIYGIKAGVIWYFIEAIVDLVVGLFVGSMELGYCFYGIAVMISEEMTMLIAVEKDSMEFLGSLNKKNMSLIVVLTVLYIVAIVIAGKYFGTNTSYSIFDIYQVDYFTPLANRILVFYTGVILVAVNHSIKN